MPSVRTLTLLGLLLLIQLTFWKWSLSYEHFLTLSGYLAMNFMSITVLLASRPIWLEIPAGGLDMMYALHKWTGLLALVFALAHWLTEMGEDLLKAILDRDRSLQEPHFSGLLDSLQDGAEDIGEPGLYILLFLIGISLLRWIPYFYWRQLHRLMPLIYLALTAHALLLAPLSWWQEPTGWVMFLLILGGIFASVQSLSGKIGGSRRYPGKVTEINPLSSQINEIVCDLGKEWPGHCAGQFALVTFDLIEGPHPFTLASADQTNGQLRFQIKALGDYTRKISHSLQVGQQVKVEGPYGRFDPEHGRIQAQQLWVAGGIGITPFLAALEYRLMHPEHIHSAVTLHYCSAGMEEDPMAKQLKQMISHLPEITLHLHDSEQGQRLTTHNLSICQPKVDLWFCGPQTLADSLRNGLKQSPLSLRFHQEIFKFR
ncbi:ferredoxin reductase family protein [Nitrincola tapanii]|uniref:Ferric reductase n=1 Tax=Nitrincola tapanii TaxID=1708751 RepID=A0A5A9W2Q4_9GAMM|nr:ferric reductase-like transmembrane domain-containing protein [Nitrincola tapanii]KAA0875026.1 ferric reductase [Nitrincola tapanii]